MKNAFCATLFLAIFMVCPTTSFCQESPARPDKFYSMSGFGFSFPVGENASFMRPKFSTTIGVNLGLGNQGLFLYPKLSLHVYGYDNYPVHPNLYYNFKQGRATTYLLNVALGYRKIVSRFAFYGFAGMGAGFVLTPRVSLDEASRTVTLNNRTNHMVTIEPGAGMEYNIGGANVFIESSFMHGLDDIGGHPFNAAPFTIGIKPNLSKLFQ